jgi:glycine cleavage system transcriptional repressor
MPHSGDPLAHVYHRAVAHFALSAIGRDRPGIVAGVTGTLLEHEVNLEDSQMAILRGHFTMTLIVSAPDLVDLPALRADLERTRARLGLDAITVSRVSDTPPDERGPSHIVTVYGADHPGLVHAVTAELTHVDVNVTDLNTRLVDQDGDPLYVMMLEVALPDGLGEDELRRLLEVVAREQEVEVSVRPLDQVAL